MLKGTLTQYHSTRSNERYVYIGKVCGTSGLKVICNANIFCSLQRVFKSTFQPNHYSHYIYIYSSYWLCILYFLANLCCLLLC